MCRQTSIPLKEIILSDHSLCKTQYSPKLNDKNCEKISQNIFIQGVYNFPNVSCFYNGAEIQDFRLNLTLSHRTAML